MQENSTDSGKFGKDEHSFLSTEGKQKSSKDKPLPGTLSLSRNFTAAISSVFSVFLVISSFFLSACSNDQSAGSTNVETGGVIAGVVQHNDGNVAPGTDLRLYRTDLAAAQLVTSSLEETVADDSGAFSFASLESGEYQVEAYHSGAKTRFITTKIAISQNAEVDLNARTLHTPAFAWLVRDSLAEPVPGEVFVLGSSLTWTFSAEADSILLDSIPAGTPVEIYFQQDSVEWSPELVANPLTFAPKDTIRIDFE